MRKLILTIIIAMSLGILPSQAGWWWTTFKSPPKSVQLETLSRLQIGTTLQKDYIVVYRVPLKLGGSQSPFNTRALTKKQYKAWKKEMVYLVKAVKNKRMKKNEAKTVAYQWQPPIK